MGEKFSKDKYKQQIQSFQPKKSIFLSCTKAFIIGGLICMVGQGLQNFYVSFFDFTVTSASNPTIATIILLAALFTGLGVFDKLGQFAGAGTLIPVTGFANSMASAALEHKSEGLVLGIANNMFKIAGAVLVYGVVAAAIIGFIRYSITILLS